MVQSTRRQLFQLAGLTALGSQVLRLTPAHAAAGPPPPSFPPGIEVYRQAYENWAGDVVAEAVWTCAPRTPAEVVAVADWARTAGYRLRARGMMHGWSPLTITPGEDDASSVVLVDTTQHLTAVSVAGDTVTVQAGATMDRLLVVLEQHGRAFLHAPAPGDITVGGALAIDAHGTAVPAVGEARPAGATCGTLSNLVVSMTVVAWDAAEGRYALKTVQRAAPEAKALLVHLGRALVVDVTLRTTADVPLRCQSWVDIPAAELFAAPGTAGARTVASFLDSAGRMEVIWFPFTDTPWLKVWSVFPTRPFGSRAVTEPYNYPFSDNVPEELSDLGASLVSGNGAATPAFGRSMLEGVRLGLLATQSADLWGPSRCTLLYVRPTTMRIHADGYAVMCRRADVQQVIHDLCGKHAELVAAAEERGEYPMNMPVEIRVTGLDDAAHVGVPGAEPPTLSACAPRPDHPEWDSVVWFDALTFPGTPGAMAFLAELERWVLDHFSGWAGVRPEWSKGWGYTAAGAWRDDAFLDGLPARFPAGSYQSAVASLDDLDPHRVFTNALVDRLLQA